MKSQLVILKLILISCSLLATNATDQQCDELVHQCIQFKTQCIPNMMTLKSCCDLIHLPLSKAPSAVYQITPNCSCHLSSFSIYKDPIYCDMETANGGWMVIQKM